MPPTLMTGTYREAVKAMFENSDHRTKRARILERGRTVAEVRRSGWSWVTGGWSWGA